MRYELRGKASSTDQHIEGRRVQFTSTYYKTDDYEKALKKLAVYTASSGKDFAVLDGGMPVAYGGGGVVRILTPQGTWKVIPLEKLGVYCQVLGRYKEKVRERFGIPKPESRDTTEGMSDKELLVRRAIINKSNKDRKRGEGLTGAEKYDVIQALREEGSRGAIDAFRKIKRNRGVRDRHYGVDFPNA